MSNVLVHTLLPVPEYRVIYMISKTGPGLPYTLDGFNHIYCYMDDVITEVEGGPKRKLQVFDDTVRALK